MNAKRFLAMLLVLIMMTSSLVGLVSCKPEGTGEGTSAAETTPAVETDKEITLFENGKWLFSIVRHRQLTNMEESASISMRTELSKIVGGERLEFKNDMLKDGESYDSEAYEIYYGNTQHPEMQALFPTVGLGEAVMKIVGNKILIASNSYEGYERITYTLATLCENNYKDGKITVPASELEKTVVFDKTLNEIPSPDGLVLESSESCEFKQTLLIFEDATPEIYQNYIKKFEGFTTVQSIESVGNYFTTFSKGTNSYNVSYSKGDEKIRVILNEDTTPTKFFEEPASVEKKVEPLLIMRGLASEGAEGNQNGLCMILRLSDGRFIVIDGGFNRQNDADQLYLLLKKNAPAGVTVPTIAAWIITHAHGDHDGTFTNKFIASYGKAVNIESVIFNPPSLGINKSSNEAGTSIEGAQYTKIANLINTIDGCEWIRAHVGDRYYIGDAVIDVIYSVDYYYPTTFTYYNTCSLILSIEIAGQRFMMTGDAANASFGKAVAMFGDSLKCDIVQVAHHGYGTGTSEGSSTSIMQAYRYMSPELVLWPIGPLGYESIKNKTYNQVLVKLPSVKEIIVALTDTHYIELPFKAK